MPSGQRQGGGMPGGGGMNSPAVTGRTKVPRDVTLMGRQCVAPPVTLGRRASKFALQPVSRSP